MERSVNAGSPTARILNLSDKQEVEMLSGYKTYITAAVAVVTALGLYLAGDANVADTAQTIFTAVMAAFIRHGISTGV